MCRKLFMIMTPELLFHNGTVFDGRRFLPAGTGVRVRAGRIEVKIGPPLALAPELFDQPPAKARRVIADQVMAAIKQLSGQEYVHMFASDRKAELAAAAPPKRRSRP